jgi:hypothetical protein
MPTSGGVSRGSIWSWRSDSSFPFTGTRYEIPARIVLTLAVFALVYYIMSLMPKERSVW